MMRKFTALLAALAIGMTALAVPAYAQRRHDGYYDRGGHHDYDRRRYYRRHHDHDNGDAVAAGAVGLILGLAIGSLASQPRQPQNGCYDNYRRCAAPPPPPPRCSQRCDDAYSQNGYYQGGSAYADDYALDGGYDDNGYAPPPPPSQRMCRERQWDRYAQRYLMVDVPC